MSESFRPYEEDHTNERYMHTSYMIMIQAKGNPHQSLCHAVWTLSFQNCKPNKPLWKGFCLIFCYVNKNQMNSFSELPLSPYVSCCDSGSGQQREGCRDRRESTVLRKIRSLAQVSWWGWLQNTQTCSCLQTVLITAFLLGFSPLVNLLF